MTDKTYPIYGTDDLNPGMYLALFHGFKDATEREAVDNWGEPGAVFGPLEFAHTTYACEIKMQFKNTGDTARYPFAEKYGDNFAVLPINADVVVFDGMEYGDWTCFVIEKKHIGELHIGDKTYPIKDWSMDVTGISIQIVKDEV